MRIGFLLGIFGLAACAPEPFAIQRVLKGGDTVRIEYNPQLIEVPDLEAKAAEECASLGGVVGAFSITPTGVPTRSSALARCVTPEPEF